MRTKDFLVLIIEDDPNDLLLIEQAFRRNGVTNPIYSLNGGHEAILYLNGEGQYADRSRFPYPSFICTDLKMPRGDGLLILEHLKSRPEWGIIPTVVLSGSSDP